MLKKLMSHFNTQYFRFFHRPHVLMISFSLLLMAAFQNCSLSSFKTSESGQSGNANSASNSDSTYLNSAGANTTTTLPPKISEKFKFMYTKGLQTMQAPQYAKSVVIKVWGGGTGISNNSGGGGFTLVEMPISPGTPFEIYVGGSNGTYNGTLGWGYTLAGKSSGFGGGSSSAIVIDGKLAVISAAGGAGGDSGNGAGGAAGEDSPTGGGKSGFNMGLGVDGGLDQVDGKGGDAAPVPADGTIYAGNGQCGSGGAGYIGGGGGSCSGSTAGGGGGINYIDPNLIKSRSEFSYGSRGTMGNKDDVDTCFCTDGYVVLIFSNKEVGVSAGEAPHIGTSRTDFTTEASFYTEYFQKKIVYLVKDQPIENIIYKNLGGDITRCTVLPPLPMGLSMNEKTCEISGTPTAQQTPVIYQVKAENSYGSSSQLLRLEVK